MEYYVKYLLVAAHRLHQPQTAFTNNHRFSCQKLHYKFNSNVQTYKMFA